MDATRLAQCLSRGPIAYLIWSDLDWTRPPCFVSDNASALRLEVAPLQSGAVSFLGLIDEADRLLINRTLREAITAGRTAFPLPDARLKAPGGAVSAVSLSARVDGRDLIVAVSEAWGGEQAAARDRTRLELVVSGTRLGMWDWNPQTNEVTFDARWAEMLGHSLGEISQSLESWSGRVHPDDIDSCYADIGRHMSGETDFYENVHRMRHADGSWRYILDRGKIVERDADGKPLRFTGTHTDITAQKEAEQQARAAVQAKSRFLATMSHEIRTPLHGILGLLSALEASTLNEEQETHLSLMRSCGDSLLGLINDILDFSKMEDQQLQISPHPFSLREELSAACKLYGTRAVAQGLELSLRIDPTLPEGVLADALRIKQILMNLVNNAIKFTARGGVYVALRRDGSGPAFTLELEVQDTGKGITDTEAIWDRFSQEDGDIARQYGGSGLGLSIVRELCALMGGTVTVDSTIGVGSRFVVQLPVTAHTLAPEVSTPSKLPPLSVLIVDDNPINQLVLRTQLGRLGLPCRVAADGAQAVQEASLRPFDVVFMDMHMPGMDGCEATRRIRRRGDSAFICALSADSSAEAKDNALRAGVDAFLGKPSELSSLIDVLYTVAAQTADQAAM